MSLRISRVFLIPFPFQRVVIESFSVGYMLLLEGSVTFHGTLPSDIANCLNLGRFHAYVCCLFSLHHLTQGSISDTLSIEASRMSGFIPTSLGNLTLLNKLWMRDSNFTGSIPDSLQNLSNLNSMDFRGNSFTGTLPEWLGELPLLHRLRVYWNDFSGSVPSSLCRATLDFNYDCNQPCDCCSLCGPVT